MIRNTVDGLKARRIFGERVRSIFFAIAFLFLAAGGLRAEDTSAARDGGNEGTGDSPRLGTSIGIRASIDDSFSPALGNTIPELILRWRFMEFAFRYEFGLRTHDMALDFGIAPRSGSYAPVVGIGARLYGYKGSYAARAGAIEPYAYESLTPYAFIVPLRFRLWPVTRGGAGGSGSEVFFSFLKFRAGPIIPDTAKPGDFTSSFLIESELAGITVFFGK